jgi:hypothetical protein
MGSNLNAEVAVSNNTDNEAKRKASDHTERYMCKKRRITMEDFHMKEFFSIL